MKFIFQNIHENNRFSVKIVPTCYNLKPFETMKVQLLKVEDVPALLHLFQSFEQPFTSSSSTSTSRFIDAFSEVTYSGTDTASQQSNFFEISILLDLGVDIFAKA